jgi:hypothetical protein
VLWATVSADDIEALARWDPKATPHKEFDPDEAEMTRTRKVRRDFMERKYQELIDALLGEDDRFEVTASVLDGSSHMTSLSRHAVRPLIRPYERRTSKIRGLRVGSRWNRSFARP